MKSRIIRNYIIRILLITVIYIGVIIVVDYGYNGAVMEFLYGILPVRDYYLIYSERSLLITIGYCLVVIIASAVYIIKLSRVLYKACCSIDEEEPFKNSCPDELAEFSQKLRDFKYRLKINEQARVSTEQQKNDLVVYLAHDLKTPLTSVIGYLTLLKETPELKEEQREKYIGIALDKAYRLEQLTNEFFDITRMNMLNMTTQRSRVNLTILLVQIISEFFPMLEEKGITVRQEIAPELLIEADADKFARVLDNLFRNAVNYSYQGTEIVCSAQKTEDSVTISIKNKGAHIPAEELEHIFDKFYRLDSARQSSTGGAGLGLVIAKQIVELHNGTIEALCEEGVTEFRIVMPL